MNKTISKKLVLLLVVAIFGMSVLIAPTYADNDTESTNDSDQNNDTEDGTALANETESETETETELETEPPQSDEEEQHTEPEDIESNENTPGFSIMCVMLSMAILFLVMRNKA